MKFFGLIAALFFTATVVAQGVNKTDAQGRKQGVWQKRTINQSVHSPIIILLRK
jgi:hypothetical protein